MTTFLTAVELDGDTGTAKTKHHGHRGVDVCLPTTATAKDRDADCVVWSVWTVDDATDRP